MLRPLKHRNAGRGGGKQLPAGAAIRVVDFGEGLQPATAVLTNGSRAPGSCLRCAEPPCMTYASAALPDAFAHFPASPNPNVCPTDAISWPDEAAAPSVAEDQCIGCGLCAVRCPAGAIHISAETGLASLNDEPNALFRLAPVPAPSPAPLGFSSSMAGRVADEGSVALTALPDRIAAVVGFDKEVLARNLLRQAGWHCWTRRPGDTNVRLDALFTGYGMVGVAEVETRGDILEVPRRLLDDLAVLESRYQLAHRDLLPLAVLLELPNNRSEYWRVITDVHRVLDVRLRTVTLGALCVLVWAGRPLPLANSEAFHARDEARDLAPWLEAALGRSVGNGYAGWLRPAK